MKIKKILPIIGIALFLYILIRLDISRVFNEIVHIKLNYLGFVVFLVFLFLIIQTIKWFVIARVQKIKVPFAKAFKINIISAFYSFITPSKLGGIIRADYLRKYNSGNLGKGVSNFVIDKILDLCSLVFIVIVVLTLFKNVLPIHYLYYSLMLLVFLLIFILILRDEKKTKFLLGAAYKKLVPEKIKEKTRQGLHSFYENMPKKRYFILFFLINLFNWVYLYTIMFFIGLSLGINVSYFYFLAILPVSTLIGQIPITINGLGTREAVMISLFGLLHVEAAKVFSMSILGMIIIEILPLIFGGFLLFKDKEKL